MTGRDDRRIIDDWLNHGSKQADTVFALLLIMFATVFCVAVIVVTIHRETEFCVPYRTHYAIHTKPHSA